MLHRMPEPNPDDAIRAPCAPRHTQDLQPALPLQKFGPPKKWLPDSDARVLARSLRPLGSMLSKRKRRGGLGVYRWPWGGR